MIRLKPMSAQWIVRVAGIFAALLPAGWSLYGFLDLRAVEDERDRRARDLAVLARVVPPPTGQSAARLREILLQAGQSLGAIRAEFEDHAFHAPVPSNRSEAFFELARYVTDMRALAAACGVVCREDELFGFATHARSGPANAQIREVHRQRLAAEILITLLLESGPARFEGLQRERPGPVGSGLADSDFFEIDPAVSVRQSDLVDTVPLRVVFTGRTVALRDFLNHLVARSPRFVVRDVAVEVVSEPWVAGEQAPWVRSGDSRFAVTVEWVELAADRDGAGTE